MLSTSEMAHQHGHDSDDENNQPPFKLTISEYEEVAARLEASQKQLDLVQTALDTPENTRALSEQIERDCEQMTLRVLFGIHEKSRASASKPGIVTDIYRCTVKDIGKRAFIVLKHPKSRPMKFAVGDEYLADKVKLQINRLGEVVLISTSLTVLRVETDEPNSI